MIYKYSVSPIYPKWKSDKKLKTAFEKMPDRYYKKIKLEGESRVWTTYLSFEYQKGFMECFKNKIQEPNTGLCDIIKQVY